MNRSFHSFPRRQQGATLAGFVLGVLLALIAVFGIVLMLNKGNDPFVDRADQRGQVNALAPNTDPNAPLSNDPASGGSPVQTLPGATATPTPAPGASATPGAVPVTPPAAAPSGVPPAGKVPEPQTSVTAQPPTGAAPVQPGTQVAITADLQVGAYQVQAEAQNAKVRMALLGENAEVSEAQGPNGTIYRVRLGPYNSTEALNKARSALAADGIETTIVRVK